MHGLHSESYHPRCATIYLSIHLSIYPSIHPSIHLSISLSLFLWTVQTEEVFSTASMGSLQGKSIDASLYFRYPPICPLMSMSESSPPKRTSDASHVGVYSLDKGARTTYLGRLGKIGAWLGVVEAVVQDKEASLRSTKVYWCRRAPLWMLTLHRTELCSSCC